MEITLSSADQVLGLVFTLGAMQVSKTPFMSKPDVINYIRIAFAVSSVLQILLALLIKYRISRKNLMKKFKYKPEASLLNMVEPTDQEEVEISYFEYDNGEATKHLRSIVFQAAFFTFLTYKFGAVQPLIIKAANLLKSLLFSPLYRAYLYNMDVERPFEKNLLFPTKKVEAVVDTTQEKKKKKEE